MKNKLFNLIQSCYVLGLAMLSVFTLFFVVLYDVFKIIIHPILWIWTFFQCGFIIDYYVRKKYFNLKEGTLVRYNKHINSPARIDNTRRNKIYRWCTFKIFERNSWKYDPCMR